MEWSTAESRFKDRFFLLALLAGPLIWVLMWLIDLSTVEPQVVTVKFQQLVLVGLVYPVLEELAFRGGLQSSLLHFPAGRSRHLGLTHANFVTSVVFVAFHFIIHAPLWALLVFIPSLIFGELRDRYQSTRPAIFLHSYYNLGFYLTLYLT